MDNRSTEKQLGVKRGNSTRENDPFEVLAGEYDAWFDAHPWAYCSEVEAVRHLLPAQGEGLEVGVGTGRFAAPLSITTGVDPSMEMASLASAKGINVFTASAEELPFPDERFDHVLMVNVLCFLDDPDVAMREACRVLKPGGTLVVAIINKNSALGRRYEASKEHNPFYKQAHFYGVPEVIALLDRHGFQPEATCQTIFGDPDTMTGPDSVRDGFGEGAFVVIAANRTLIVP